MKLIPPIVLAAAFAVVAGGSVQAQERGWYVRGDLGGSFQGEFDADRKQDLESAVFGAAGAGYDLGNGLRAEGELTYSKSDFDGASGDAKSLGGFANIVYDFKVPGLPDQIRPFVGAGVGFANVKLDDGLVDDDDTGFAYQAKAGVSYKVNDRLTAEMAYRYQRVADVQFRSGASDLEGDLGSQAITVGLRYKLGR